MKEASAGDARKRTEASSTRQRRARKKKCLGPGTGRFGVFGSPCPGDLLGLGGGADLGDEVPEALLPAARHDDALHRHRRGRLIRSDAPPLAPARALCSVKEGGAQLGCLSSRVRAGGARQKTLTVDPVYVRSETGTDQASSRIQCSAQEKPVWEMFSNTPPHIYISFPRASVA